MTRLIIGLGSGRCGTVSLSELLNLQVGADVSHESRPVLPWLVDRQAIKSKVHAMCNRDAEAVGDVGYYYLPYVRLLLASIADVRFVCLRRDPAAVLQSMIKKTERTNHWTEHDGGVWRHDPAWDQTMPSYEMMPKEMAIRRYLREYYEMAENLERDYRDHFRIFQTEDALNEPAAAERLLRFAGFEEPRVVLGITANRLVTRAPKT